MVEEDIYELTMEIKVTFSFNRNMKTPVLGQII